MSAREIFTKCRACVRAPTVAVETGRWTVFPRPRSPSAATTPRIFCGSPITLFTWETAKYFPKILLLPENRSVYLAPAGFSEKTTSVAESRSTASFDSMIARARRQAASDPTALGGIGRGRVGAPGCGKFIRRHEGLKKGLHTHLQG